MFDKLRHSLELITCSSVQGSSQLPATLPVHGGGLGLSLDLLCHCGVSCDITNGNFGSFVCFSIMAIHGRAVARHTDPPYIDAVHMC